MSDKLDGGGTPKSSTNLETIQVNPKTRDIISTTPAASDKMDRAMSKDGTCNYVAINVDKRKWKFMTDIFTTFLEIQWRWTLFGFCVVYFGSWLLFAFAWYGILYFHGDAEHFGEEGWIPCITGIQNFTSSFLFSVETQHTTGYGMFQITEECPSAVILFCIQSIVGCILEGLMVGLVFLKMGRAKKRRETLMFSRNSVINFRDGLLCFMFRIADMRINHLMDAHVRAQVVRKRTTSDGEVIPVQGEEIEVGGEGERGSKILFFWPTTVIHKITEKSPLWNITEMDLNSANNDFEIIVVLEGIVDSTGLNVQARSSYLPSEILWGHRFENLTSSKTRSGFRTIDYTLFHETRPVEMPPPFCRGIANSVQKKEGEEEIQI